MSAETGVRTFDAGWETNGVSWSSRAPHRLAVSSFLSDYRNNISIVQCDPETSRLVRIGNFEHYYPPTKTMYNPLVDNPTTEHEMFATSGDYLRLWSLDDEATNDQAATGEDFSAVPSASATLGRHEDQADARAGDPNQAPAAAAVAAKTTLERTTRVQGTLEHTFKRQSDNEFCAPLTSFDWHRDAPGTIATCSIDTTVALWDVEKQELAVQLIAHDKEVFDVARARGPHLFATAGADGSVRVFDLRKMESCTIVHETPGRPMLRVAWNRHDPWYLAALGADSADVVIVDIRYPSMPVGNLQGHTGAVNAVQWAPHDSGYICTAGEDKTAFIWKVADAPRVAPTPMLTYDLAGAEINSVAWSALDIRYMAVTFDRTVQTLLV